MILEVERVKELYKKFTEGEDEAFAVGVHEGIYLMLECLMTQESYEEGQKREIKKFLKELVFP